MARTPDKPPGQPVHAAIYARISDDQEGEAWGIGDQERHSRSLAERLGWTVVDVYADNDISISKYSKRKREHYERLLQDITGGRVNAILVTESSRLFRRELEGLQFEADYGEPYGLKIKGLDFSVDFVTGEGVFGWKLKALVDAEESERTRQRVIRKELYNAQLGLPKKGGIRRFGYEADAVTIIPEEAALVRDAAERFLAGESLGDIVRVWNKSGITPPPHTRRVEGRRIIVPGKAWRVTTVRNALSRAYIAGYRDHHTAGMVKGTWEPILDKTTWDRVQMKLAEPERKKAGPKRVRRYLLSGFLYCGICDQRMTAAPRADKSRTYVCKRAPGLPGCGHIRRKAEPVEELITGYIIALIENTPEIERGLNPNSQLEARAAELDREIARYTGKLEELSNDYYVEESITREEFFASRPLLEKRIEHAERERRRLLGGMALVAIGDTPIREAWEPHGLSWRRELVSALIEKIIIHPTDEPGRKRFDPSKIEVIWRDRDS